MHRIDGPGHSNNLFTEGDPTQAIPATVVTDDWANAVQEEIVQVILGAGITLNKPVNTQLRDAINLLIEPIIALSSVAALRALPATSHFGVRRTLGYYTPGDGGGETYWWNASDTRADNGGNVLQPDTLPASGRWNAMQVNNVFNARRWGCKADGTTDDSARAQAMFNQINSEKGGKAYFPRTASFYRLVDVRVYSHTEVFGDSYQWPFNGDGGSQITIMTHSGTKAIFWCDAAVNVRFRDLHLVGPGDYQAQASKGIELRTTTTYTEIRGCGFRAFTRQAIHMHGTANTNVVEDCIIFGAAAIVADLTEPIGALQIDSGENWVYGCQITAGHNQNYPSNTNLYMCCLLDKGFFNWYENNVFDFGDIGAYVAGQGAKFDFCRAGSAWGHCWYLHDLVAPGSLSGVKLSYCIGDKLSSGTHANNTFDVFHVTDDSGLTGGIIAEHCIASGDAHRYGWYEGGQDGAGGGINQGTVLFDFKCQGELTAKWAGRNDQVPGPIWVNKGWVPAGDGDTTPSVAGIEHLILFNSAPTDITDFDGHSNNQEITLYTTTGNTTLKHNASLMLLPGGSDYTIPAFVMIKLKRIGSTWVKIS